LISQGFRELLSVDSGANSRVKFWQIEDKIYDAHIVGLMEKAGSSGFTKRKVDEGSEKFGKTIHTTTRHFKMLLDDMAKREPMLTVKLEQLNAQYQFKDGIPKA